MRRIAITLLALGCQTAALAIPNSFPEKMTGSVCINPADCASFLCTDADGDGTNTCTTQTANKLQYSSLEFNYDSTGQGDGCAAYFSVNPKQVNQTYGYCFESPQQDLSLYNLVVLGTASRYPVFAVGGQGATAIDSHGIYIFSDNSTTGQNWSTGFDYEGQTNVKYQLPQEDSLPASPCVSPCNYYLALDSRGVGANDNMKWKSASAVLSSAAGARICPSGLGVEGNIVMFGDGDETTGESTNCLIASPLGDNGTTVYMNRRNFQIGSDDGIAHKFRIQEDSDFGINLSTFAAQAQAGDIDYVLPASGPAANEVLSCASGCSATGGTLDWVAGGAGSVGGSGTTGRIPYWTAATTLGDTQWEWNTANNTIRPISDNTLEIGDRSNALRPAKVLTPIIDSGHDNDGTLDTDNDGTTEGETDDWLKLRTPSAIGSSPDRVIFTDGGLTDAEMRIVGIARLKHSDPDIIFTGSVAPAWTLDTTNNMSDTAVMFDLRDQGITRFRIYGSGTTEIRPIHTGTGYRPNLLLQESIPFGATGDYYGIDWNPLSGAANFATVTGLSFRPNLDGDWAQITGVGVSFNQGGGSASGLRRGAFIDVGFSDDGVTNPTSELVQGAAVGFSDNSGGAGALITKFYRFHSVPGDLDGTDSADIDQEVMFLGEQSNLDEDFDGTTNARWGFAIAEDSILKRGEKLFWGPNVADGNITVVGSRDASLDYDGTDLGFDIGTTTEVTLTGSLLTTGGVGHVLGACSAVTPAASITANACNTITLNAGSTQIDTIATCDAPNTGRVLYVLCGAGTPAFGDGAGNINTAGSFTCAANDVLTLICSGSTWFEVSRSLN